MGLWLGLRYVLKIIDVNVYIYMYIDTHVVLGNVLEDVLA